MPVSGIDTEQSSETGADQNTMLEGMTHMPEYGVKFEVSFCSVCHWPKHRDTQVWY